MFSGSIVDTVARRLQDCGFRLYSLDAPPGTPADLQATLSVLGELSLGRVARPWVLLDGYAFGPEYQWVLREMGYRVLMLDDKCHQPMHRADVVINQSFDTEALAFPADLDAVLLLGPRYALLRQEFRAAAREPRQTRGPVRRILVTFGASDPANITRRAVQALERVGGDAEVLVVVGPANPHREALRGLLSNAPARFRLLESPEDLPDIMAGSDLAVSAGGSTCWELAFLGVPALVTAVADNQLPLVRTLATAGAVVNLGWHAELTEQRLADAIVSLCGDVAARVALARAGKEFVDGDGTYRVLDVIAALAAPDGETPRTVTRRATWADRLQTWRVANDPLVRANSFHRQEISYDQHLQWYRAKLADRDSLFLILDVGGVLVAQVRYDRRTDDLAEVHFAVAPAFRGKRLGLRALSDTWEMACQNLGVRRIRGLVLHGNTPSARAFYSAGYSLVGESEERGFRCFIFELTCNQTPTE